MYLGSCQMGADSRLVGHRLLGAFAPAALLRAVMNRRPVFDTFWTAILFVSVATLPLCLVLTSWLMWTLPVTWATSSWHGLPDDGLWLLHEWIFVHCGGHRAVVDSQPVRHMLLGLRVGDAAARWLIMQTPCHRYI